MTGQLTKRNVCLCPVPDTVPHVAHKQNNVKCYYVMPAALQNAVVKPYSPVFYTFLTSKDANKGKILKRLTTLHVGPRYKRANKTSFSLYSFIHSHSFPLLPSSDALHFFLLEWHFPYTLIFDSDNSQE